MRQVVLFLTNKGSANVLKSFGQLKGDLENIADIFLLYHKTRKKVSKAISRYDPYVFENSILTSLNYKTISNQLIPGNNHFPLFQFYHQFPHFNYYWYIEDDVRFGGKWEMFFEFFSRNNINSDLLTSHIKTFEQEPYWHWWDTFGHTDNRDIPREKRLRSFNPIYRISNSAIKFLDKSLSSGWYGHHEVLLPTLLNHEGFTINDFGGQGTFVLPACENKFYHPNECNYSGGLHTGSMRYRPVIEKVEMTQDILYHPVK